MGVMTISLDQESENLLRETAKFHYGNRKDAISKTIIKAINNLENSRDNLKKDTIQRLKNNNKRLKVKNVKERDEFYK